MTLVGHRSAIYKLLDIPGSDKFMSLGGDGMVVEWRTDGHPDGLMLADAGEQMFTGKFLSSENWLIAGGMSGNIIWLDLNKKIIIRKMSQHKKSVFDIINLDEKRSVSASGDGSICIWNNEDQQLLLSVKVSSQGLRKLLRVSDQYLLIGSSDGHIYQINVSTWEVECRYVAHDNSVFALALGDNHIYSGGRDALLKSWSWENNELVPQKVMNAHWYTINDIIWSGSGVFTASRDKKIRAWTKDLDISGSLTFAENGHVNSVNTLILKENYLISAGDDRSIILWAKDSYQ